MHISINILHGNLEKNMQYDLTLQMTSQHLLSQMQMQIINTETLHWI